MNDDRSVTDGSDRPETASSLSSEWSSVGFYLSLAGWALYLLYETTQFTRTEDVLIPALVLTVVLVLIPLKIVTVVLSGRIEQFSAATTGEAVGEFQNLIEASTTLASRPKAEQERAELVMLLWVFVLPFMMYGLGMGWAIIIYVSAFTWYFIRDIKTVVLTTGIVSLFITVLFMHVLGIVIWDGILGLPDPFVYIGAVFETVVSSVRGG